MTLAIPVGFAQCAIHMLRGGDPQEMLWTFGVSWTAPGHDTIASDVALAWASALPRAGYGSNITYTRVTARVAEEGDEPSLQEASLQGTGTGTSPALAPQNCAVLIHKITSHGGRRGRGRMYWPNVTETDVDEMGKLTSSSQTGWATVANNFLLALADIVTGAATPMVLLHGPNKAGITAAPYPVTALTVDPVIATQRRRLRP